MPRIIFVILNFHILNPVLTSDTIIKENGALYDKLNKAIIALQQTPGPTLISNNFQNQERNLYPEKQNTLLISMACILKYGLWFQHYDLIIFFSN